MERRRGPMPFRMSGLGGPRERGRQLRVPGVHPPRLNHALLTLTPAWLMYDARLLRDALLADALQDAGCDSDDILDHCRDTSLTHVRGCWVVDLVLGKE